MVSPVTLSDIGNDHSLTAYRCHRYLLPGMLAVSIVLHVAVLVLLPDPARQPDLSPPRPLDVALASPAPMVKPEPVPVAPPPKRPETRTPKAAAAESPREVRKPESERTPVISLPESKPLPESFPVPVAPAQTKDSLPAPPQKAEIAAAGRGTAAISPPSFNAAYLRNPPPLYPLVARRNGEQGTVMLKVLVTRDGVPASVALEKTSGSFHLDNAALDTVRTWRFVPARQGTQPVEAWVLVPIVFRLETS